jgi:uncharacterized protein
VKFLLWAAIIAGVIWVLRNKKKAAKVDAPVQTRVNDESGEPMLSCTHCGIHFPASEAVADVSGATFCGDDHRRLHVSR